MELSNRLTCLSLASMSQCAFLPWMDVIQHRRQACVRYLFRPRLDWGSHGEFLPVAQLPVLVTGPVACT